MKMINVNTNTDGGSTKIFKKVIFNYIHRKSSVIFRILFFNIYSFIYKNNLSIILKQSKVLYPYTSPNRLRINSKI